MLSGPLFENKENDYFKSIHKADGGHYNIFAVKHYMEMEALRGIFVSGAADKYNQVLFSTSGIHGSFSTIEDVEPWVGIEYDEDNPAHEKYSGGVTFLIIQPRLVTLRFGVCNPKNAEDIKFLKRLRQTSWEQFQEIGKHYEEI